MHGRKLKVFIDQVHLQCEYALRAYEVWRHSVSHQSELRDNFYHVEALLNACAKVSKLLWGVESNTAARMERATLRACLGIGDQAVISRRTVRDDLEHFDERLDSWWESKYRTFVDFQIGTLNLFAGTERDVLTFRAYDPATECILFWGEEICLPRLMAEVSHLHQKSAELQKCTTWMPNPLTK